jgi:DNA-binding beta-propeller fold protein YncE/ABC-type molybdate transport system permease subunit
LKIVAWNFSGIWILNFGISLLWLPFLLPGILIGIALIPAFNRPGFFWLYQCAGIVLLAYTIRYLGLGWTVAAHARRSADPDLVDAARLEGARGWQLLRHAIWPQIAPQIAAAWYVLFLLCLWDVESMILVVPPGGETLALRIFNLLHYGHNAQVNALCVTLLVVALAPLALWKAWSAAHGAGVRVLGLATVAGLPALLAGCAPGASSTEATLPHSRLFSRVVVFSHRGVGVGELNKPRSVAVDRQDNWFVVDMTGRVQKFSPAGDFLLSWQMPQTELGKPKGMGRDCDGNVVVVEPHYQRVNHFTPEGKLVAQWGRRGTNAGQFNLPRAVAINSHNEAFVSEYGAAERVQCFRWPLGADPRSLLQTNSTPPPAAEATLLFGFGHPGTGPGEFNRPEGLCVDSHDRVYVADSCNHRIQVFTSDGKFLRTYGKPGSGPGELSYPYDICVDAAGRQYVCEFGNSRIQVFDAQDHPLEIIGGPGCAPGQFSNPWGVALDSAGNLYVADSQNHRVQKLIHRPSTAPVAADVGRGRHGSSADWQSAVSPIVNRQAGLREETLESSSSSSFLSSSSTN